MSNKIEARANFTTTLNEIMEICEENLNDGLYLQIANLLQTLYRLLPHLTKEIRVIQQVMTHIMTVHNHVNTLRANAHTNHLNRQLAWFNTPRNPKPDHIVCCQKCGRLVKKRGLKKHQETIVCKEIQNERKLCANLGNTNFTAYRVQKMEKQNKEILDELPGI